MRIPNSKDLGLKPLFFDDKDEAVCPNEQAHNSHQNAIWVDWDKVEVWQCGGLR